MSATILQFPSKEEIEEQELLEEWEELVHQATNWDYKTWQVAEEELHQPFED
jgi:hypothetical protein